ncbi:hypothetical protein Btru_022698 [Bulinus truncatus]|nr:hypothetical protein Btru_022698 [Bulinus truncatus]
MIYQRKTGIFGYMRCWRSYSAMRFREDSFLDFREQRRSSHLGAVGWILNRWFLVIANCSSSSATICVHKHFLAMEVSSSTTASTQQDFGDHYPSHDASAEVASSSVTAEFPDISTSNGETGDLHLPEGMNNTSSSDVGVGSVETVRYGPALPPSFYASEPVGYSKDVQDSKALAGSCGLYNLGNTCFMNAGIQSLISCAPLVKYFCDNYILTDGNRHTLTAQFYILLCKMWSGKFSVVHPRKFKEYLGFYHSQFEDYRQHDCQEFLALLLDTLHEQLNNATAHKGSYSSSPLPLASSSSLSSSSPPQPASFPTAVEPSAVNPMSLDSDLPFLLTCRGQSGEDDSIDVRSETLNVSDLNNKDSKSSVMSQQLLIEGTGVRSSTEFSGFAQPSLTRETARSPSYPSEGSPTSDASVSDSGITSPSSHGDITSQKSPDHEEEEEMISSSFPPLKRYTSRSNLDDVSSSDSSMALKPSLKRVSSGSSVTTCSTLFHSEDSNQSTVSAHSTDSEQSSAFKRLKIDAVELNRNANNNIKDCVTSSSDCKKSSKNRKNMLSEASVLRDPGDAMVSGNVVLSCPQKDLNVIDNMVTSCQDGLCVDVKFANPDNPGGQSQLSPGLLDDYYSKETKTLNTNVLVSEFLQEITSDSEKFAKVDNRHRPPSKEINLLQEAFGEEDKAEKVLIGQRLGGIKDTNLYAHSASAVIKPSVKNLDPNVLNNSLDLDVLEVGAVSKFSPHSSEVCPSEVLLPHKLKEEEKNIQMQAYSKFNTIPVHSNIRTDLTDSAPDADSMEIDEVEVECSDDEEIESSSHLSSVECSSVPNCLRHCPSSEVMMANRAWNEYLAKNDSIVVNTFQGQFRSTVVCSECSHVSVTYEPFMYLSLPIPHAMDQQICVVYVSQNRPPVRYLLNLLKTDKIGTVKKKLSEVMSQESGDFIMAEVLDSHISRILDDNILLKYVNTINRKIYAFEIISAESGLVSANDSISCNHLLNNDIELPSSSRLELPFATDSQVSNQSFDSINVNSPSSRDTPDYMFSDSETCDPTSQENSDFPPPYLAADDNSEGECQSTSGSRLTGASPWVYGGFSNSQRLSWTLDDYDSGLVSYDSRAVSTSAGAANFNSNKSVYWADRNKDDFDEACLQIDDRCSGSDTLSDNHTSSEAASTRSICKTNDIVDNLSSVDVKLSSLVNTHSSTNNDKSDGLASLPPSQNSFHPEVSTSGKAAASQSTVSSTVACGSRTRSNSHSGRNTSRSCPSPETLTHIPEHEATLLSVAAKLEDHPGSYFLNRSENDTDYGYFQDQASLRSFHFTLMELTGPVSRFCFQEIPCSVSFLLAEFIFDINIRTPEKILAWPGPGTATDLSRLRRAAALNCFPAVQSGSSNAAVTSCTLSEDNQQDNVWASNFTAQNSSPDDAGQIRPLNDQWRSCAICLEDLLDTELLTHVSCDGVFCQPCLEMSVKHSADVTAFCCPICLHPANSFEDFVPLANATATKPKIRTLPMSIAYRHNVRDNSGSESLQLFGHPSILHMPSVISGDSLYSLVDRMVSPLLSTYSIKLTDGQGLTCSRCTYSRHCSGCEIARDGEVVLQPSDCLTVHICDALSPDQVCEWQYVHEDSSMAGLRSSEPTTIMDCFGAFTQSEILDEHNPWYCPQCDRNQCAKKTMTVWRYPDNLIIHLKRFVYQDLSSTKVDTKVIFPHEDMDVRGFLSGPSSTGLVYDLYSIVCHFGGASAGHYTCFSKHPLTSQWHYYNDDSVCQQNPSENEYSSGYVLFYQRQGTDVVFTPPQNVPSFDEDSVHPMPPGPSYGSRNNGLGNNSMALVLFHPPSTSGQQDHHTVPEDDYDGARRLDDCDDGALSVHFGTSFPTDNQGQVTGNEAVAGVRSEKDVGYDGRTLVAEPDSTLDFYT